MHWLALEVPMCTCMARMSAQNRNSGHALIGAQWSHTHIQVRLTSMQAKVIIVGHIKCPTLGTRGACPPLVSFSFFVFSVFSAFFCAISGFLVFARKCGKTHFPQKTQKIKTKKKSKKAKKPKCARRALLVLVPLKGACPCYYGGMPPFVCMCYYGGDTALAMSMTTPLTTAVPLTVYC